MYLQKNVKTIVYLYALTMNTGVLFNNMSVVSLHLPLTYLPFLFSVAKLQNEEILKNCSHSTIIWQL